MKFGLVFMMVVEVISQKSPKIRLRNFFITFLNYQKKLSKKKKLFQLCKITMRYILPIIKFPSYSIENVFYYFYLKGETAKMMLKMAFRRLTVYFEDQIFKNLETKMVFHFLRSKVESNPNKCTNLHVLNMKQFDGIPFKALIF